MTQTEALNQLVDCAILLGQTQAKKGAGTYTQEDGRFEYVLHESIAKHSAAIKEALAQPEQEPVALQYPQKDIDWQQEQQIKAQASIPPQRTWVGLTDEEKQEWIDAMPYDPQPRHCMILVNVIEAKLKEKNT